MRKTVKMTLKGKLSGNGQMDRIFMNLKNKLTSGVIRTLSRGYIHVHVHVYDLYSQQVYWYISQILGERLQDHWPSGFLLIHSL